MNPDTNPPRHGCAAWFLGCLLYMFLALDVIGDEGMLGFLFQGVIGAVFSIFLIGVAYLLGLLFRIPSFGRVWYFNALPSVTVIVLSLGVLFYGDKLGFDTTAVSSESKAPFRTIHPAAALGSVFAAVFGVLHFTSGIRRGSLNDRG